MLHILPVGPHAIDEMVIRRRIKLHHRCWRRNDRDGLFNCSCCQRIGIDGIGGGGTVIENIENVTAGFRSGHLRACAATTQQSTNAEHQQKPKSTSPDVHSVAPRRQFPPILTTLDDSLSRRVAQNSAQLQR
jgi:hypothetical protein